MRIFIIFLSSDFYSNLQPYSRIILGDSENCIKNKQVGYNSDITGPTSSKMRKEV